MSDSREMLYIAGPYTKPLSGEDVRQQRYEMLTRASAEYMNSGFLVYSPITHTHPIDQLLAKSNQLVTLGSDYWVDLDEHFMKICDRCVVIMMEGWEESSGVRREIQYFASHGKRVDFVHPSHYVLGVSETMEKRV